MFLHPTSYTSLPALFYEIIRAKPVTKPQLVQFNHKLASSLGLQDQLTSPEIDLYAGNQDLPFPTVALAYAGHQFGQYVPLLGDGRALILGEIHHQDQQWDVQLKGSGPTRFAKRGDGCAPLAAVLREYLVSEAMHGLKIPTTRCLAAVSSTDRIYRQEGLVQQGVLTRLALSHLRVGTFQFAAANQCVKPLADYAINRLYPAIKQDNNVYLSFFRQIIERQALLIALWLSVGFIHGVMNTDNMSISGETIDYGPCAFLDEFNTSCVYSSIDYYGRYAYGNQPAIAYWNLIQLGESLKPLFDDDLDQAEEKMQYTLEYFFPTFSVHWYQQMSIKLGLQENNNSLIDELIALMQTSKVDYTSTFLLLSQALDNQQARQQLMTNLRNESWVTLWLECQKKENTKVEMERANPIYIPRNHLIEKAINDLLNQDDRRLLDTLLKVFQNPFQDEPNTEHLKHLPTDAERVQHTFCGT
jgi:serine/tyrosine/threonine adenylyltransferase